MHLGLKTDALYPMFCTKLKEPGYSAEVPDDPQTYTLDVLRACHWSRYCIRWMYSTPGALL